MQSNGRAAQSALAAARPTVERLSPERHAEELAADLIEVWSAVETAMRSLLGGSALTGQSLIRELRQRELLSLERAHSLLEFLAVRERVERIDYRPTTEDVSLARAAFHSLEQHVGSAVETVHADEFATAPPPSTGLPSETLPMGAVDEPRRRPTSMLIAGAAVLALLIGAGIAWWYFANAPERDVRRGREAYAAGQRSVARRHFESALRRDRAAVAPHIYLGRIAREEGDTASAREMLTRAVQLDPNSGLANRELASFLYSRAQYDLARRFYVRALENDPDDRLARGFLGCSLVRLGRPQEGMTFIQRAGPGDWETCARFVPLQPQGTQSGGVPPP